MKYNRVLLKLSGEALMGEKQFGIDADRISSYAEEIKRAVEAGCEVAVVIGGGNIFRGLNASDQGIDRVQGDHAIVYVNKIKIRLIIKEVDRFQFIMR